MWFPIANLHSVNSEDHNRLQQMGYYLVNGQEIFPTCFQAMHRATVLDTKDIRLVFDDDRFSAANWKQEPAESLKSLYYQRALQLRKKYNRLILRWSGGTDSTCMVKVFLENGIKVDLIITSTLGDEFPKTNPHRLEQLENYHLISNLITETNTPYIPIDIIDYYTDGFYDPWFFFTGNSSRPTTRAKTRSIYTVPLIRQWLESEQHVGMICGLEKPQLVLDNGEISAYFNDRTIMNTWESFNYDRSRIEFCMHRERFFTTGDMPKITIKQSHVMAKHFATSDNLDVLRIGARKTVVNTDQRRAAIDLLYGDYCTADQFTEVPKESLFYPDKPVLGYRDNFLWVDAPKDDPRKAPILQAINQYQTSIDPYWFKENNPWNLTIGILSRRYSLGIRHEQY